MAESLSQYFGEFVGALPFVDQIPVWDQAGTTQVGYRTSYDSGTVILFAQFTATPGAVLQTPDGNGGMAQLIVGGGTPAANGAAGTAITTVTSPAVQAQLVNIAGKQIPMWVLMTGGGAALLLLVLVMSRR